MDYDSFSHGQIQSKVWLCEHLEEFMPTNAEVKIFGSWYNILAFMLLCRKPNSYASILGIDTDPATKPIADKINDAWIINDKIVHNLVMDVNIYTFSRDNPEKSVYICCSAEHFEDNYWYDKVPEGSLICMQSSSVTDPNPPWSIKNPTPTLDDLVNRYPLKELYYKGTKNIEYATWGYYRYMIIGRK